MITPIKTLIVQSLDIFKPKKLLINLCLTIKFKGF